VKTYLLAVIATGLTILQINSPARLAESGDFEGAIREYGVLLEENPQSDTLRYNLGTAHLLAEQFDTARPHLEAGRSDPKVAPSADYNLGNTDLQPAFADSTLPDRENRLRRAIGAYRASLLASPDDMDAKWNLELAQKLLASEAPTPEGGGGGGGGQGEPTPGDLQPEPQPSGGTGSDPPSTESAVEDLLRAAQNRELEVQQDLLEKPQPPDGLRP